MSDSKPEMILTVPLDWAGWRLDKVLSELLPQYSRAAVQQWLKENRVRVNGQHCKQKTRLAGGECLAVSLPETPACEPQAQKMDLDIVHQDNEILIINKPRGLVVHPGAGNADQTLLNGLLFHDPDLGLLPRAGIVHRLDKGTTGLMVVARTEKAQQHLIAQLKTHSVRRRYVAIVNGIMDAGERIDQPIGRHQQSRLKMSVIATGKPAVTHIRLLRTFRAHSQINALLETGRTHQIRVHMSWRGYPLVGDTTYGGRVKLPERATTELTDCLKRFPRPALHAEQLALCHPGTGKTLEWHQPLPEDINRLIRTLVTDQTTQCPPPGSVGHR